MKRLIYFLLALCLWPMVSVSATDFDLLSADSSIIISCQMYDSLGQKPVSGATGDSVTVDVYYVNGSSMVGDSILYTEASTEVSIVNGLLVYEEVFGDIDGAGGDGIYIVTARFTDVSLGLHQTEHRIVTVGQYATVEDLAAESSDSTWGKAARTLTALDEDATTIDLDGSTVGGVTNGVTVTTNNDKTGYGLADDAITAAKIAADAIGSSEIATGAIGTAEFNDNTSGEIADSVWGLASRMITGSVDVSSISGTAATEIDSILAMASRAAIALYYPCDTSFVREYPLGQKPKDSICVYCVSATGPATADTTKVATFYSNIHNKATSTENVIDSLSAEKK